MESVSKETAETAILERFLIAYQKRFGIELTNVIHRDSPDFDITIPTTNEQIGIEITGAYQNEREAKIQYGVIEDWDQFEGSSEEFVASLNRRLDEKAKKSSSYKYSGRIFLVIWLGSLVFDQKFDVDFIRPKLVIPKNNFSEIWLIIRNKDDYSPELCPLQTGNTIKPC